MWMDRNFCKFGFETLRLCQSWLVPAIHLAIDHHCLFINGKVDHNHWFRELFLFILIFFSFFFLFSFYCFLSCGKSLTTSSWNNISPRQKVVIRDFLTTCSTISFACTKNGIPNTRTIQVRDFHEMSKVWLLMLNIWHPWTWW